MKDDMFTPYRLEVLSETTRDIAQVFFASIFIVPLVGSETSSFLIASGFILSVTSWYLNLSIVKN